MQIREEQLIRRKEALHEEAEQIATLQQRVNEVQECDDYLVSLPHFQQYCRRGLGIIIQSCRGCPCELGEWALDLTSRNMKGICEGNWAWNEKAKEHELREYAANFLFAISDGVPVGFVHFRFEQQNGEFVLFIYDVQVEPEIQRRGLGSHLVTGCEFIALEKKAPSVMTQVFIDSPGKAFFEKLGYRPHSCSPESLDPERKELFKHQILFKPIGKRRPSAM
jgi:GNAT superfamily N-acetyltransferase